MRLIDAAHDDVAHGQRVRKRTGGDDGRIAVPSAERVSEALLQRRQRFRTGKAIDRRSARMVELPEIVDAVAMVGMVVRPDHRVDGGNVGVEQLLAQIG